MAVEETTTTTTSTLPEPENKNSDLLRKIAAAVVGIIVIILIVLAAKWIGDRVRDRFFPGSGAVVSPVPTQLPTGIPTAYPSGYITPVPSGTKPNYPTSPSTGPNSLLYIVIGLMALGGAGTLVLAKR